MSDKLTQTRLKELLHYCTDTGIFNRRVSLRGHANEGDVAGHKDRRGYIRITIDDRRYLAHRLAWLYAYGEMPSAYLDHINGIQDDNRIENLREATVFENARNTRLRKNNTSGFKGVYLARDKRMWCAGIKICGKKVHLGTFNTPEDAHKAYCDAARKHFGEFTNTGEISG
ncbi:HNH endonuclease [Maritalea porphyrae]|uniref:HNH endonuclease n=1 Tax=Maritalea porphyrae TaxID=880732 RepID=UPI0022AE7405|nr:HNH endonuclease [Maritalea porphyrae]MCZ4270939.1 HNH endonuclease [Maritalea porphyrae]